VFDTIAGLPIHPLAVHAVVVLLPLACLLTIATALRPSWRRHARWVFGFNALVAAAALAAKQSGERLDHRFRENGQPSQNLLNHELWGGRLAIMAALLVVAAALVAFFHRSANLSRVAAVVAVLFALATVGVTVYVGDSGARDVWSGLIQSTK
jgi:uncharacterized membrane protein